ncbi:NUCLEAR FUSION DEFECTIVE 4 protein [Nymphaea thermarum]|nr:NUCLEAR FUSION DEFECTIVE 4 protein [Nymphaea thermarum]
MGVVRRPSSATLSAWKWLGLVTAVWVQAVSGNNYTFSNYSDAIKSLLNLNQVELNNLSVAKDIGKAFGLLAGFASDYLPTWAILLIGSLEGFAGYGAQWLVVSRRISPLPYWQMCVVLCMGGNSTTWMNTAVLVTCIRNFRQSRGPVSGLLKGYIGLSTAIFTDLSSALFAGSPSYFLLMLTVLPGLVCVTAMVFLRELPAEDAARDPPEAELRCFSVLNFLAVVIALYLLVNDLTGAHGVAFSRVFSAGLVVLLATPLVIPAYMVVGRGGRKGATAADGNDVESVRQPLVAAEQERKVEEEEREGEKQVEHVRGTVVIGEEHTIGEAVRTWEFWILFGSFLCGVGTGLAVMNNLGQIGSALGYADVSMFVSLTSIFGFFGRILSGSLSEHFIRLVPCLMRSPFRLTVSGDCSSHLKPFRFAHSGQVGRKSATPRPMWNAASQIVMAAGYIIMAMALPGSLYVGSIVVGMCYGVRIAVSVPTASELFGLKYYGLIYNILILNLPLGSFLFSGLLAGILYDKEATSGAGGFNTCVGAHCYRLVFLIMSVACVIGFGLDLLLSFRMKDVYLKIQATKNARAEKKSASSARN